MKISTNDAGIPIAELTLTSPKGAKHWIFALAPESDEPELIYPAEPTEPEPQWVTAAVFHWMSCIQYLRCELKLRDDEAKRTQGLLASFHDMARIALQYDQPGARAIVTRQANQLSSRMKSNSLPRPLRDTYLEAASRLYTALRQFDPRYCGRDEGPTPETAAKVYDGAASPIELLEPALGAVATEIQEIWRVLTRKLDAKAVNLEGGNGTIAHSYTQPLEGMPPYLAERYLEDYRPWAQELGIRRAVPHRTATCFQVVMSMIVDGWHFDRVERHFQLPPGLARSMLFRALRTYGSESWKPRPLDIRPEKRIACGRA